MDEQGIQKEGNVRQSDMIGSVSEEERDWIESERGLAWQLRL